MEIRTRGGKSFGIHYTGYRDNGVGHVIAISCLSVIENLCLAYARKGSGVTRTRAGKKARDIGRASRRVFFALPTPWLLKGRRAAYEGTEKKGAEKGI